jgi:hypothetical protein
MIFAAIAGLVVALALGAVCQQLAVRRRCRAPFLELARRHGLSAEQVRLAWQVARRFVPATPLQVFVRPSLWQRAALARAVDVKALRTITARLFEA